MGHYENSAELKVHSTKCIHKEVKKSHSSDLTEHLKTLEQKEDSPRRYRNKKESK